MTTPSPFRPVLERLAYVCHMAVLGGSISMTGLGLVLGIQSGNYFAMCLALGGLILSRWLHVHGHAHWHFREWEDSFDAPVAGLMTDREQARAEEIAELFEKFEAEEDVWVRGAIRREISAGLTAMPTLRSEFAEPLSRHPDL